MLCNPTLKFVGPSIGLSAGLSVGPSITFSPSITLHYLMFLWSQFLYHTHPHCDKWSGAYRDRLCKSRYANFYGCVVNFKSGRHLPHFKILGAGGQNTSCIFLFGRGWYEGSGYKQNSNETLNLNKSVVYPCCNKPVWFNKY